VIARRRRFYAAAAGHPKNFAATDLTQLHRQIAHRPFVGGIRRT
jgi:hypothetical protein